MPLGHAGGRMATLKLRVTGMTCGHCQMKVEKALRGASGVYSAVVALSAGEAGGDFNADAATTDQLIAAGATSGYGGKMAGAHIHLSPGRGRPFFGSPHAAGPGGATR